MARFCEKLKQVMQERQLTQAQVVGLTGCSKASISQYLSGKNVPNDIKRRDIALALNLNPDYFQSETIATQITAKADGETVPKLDVNVAARLLGMNHNTIRKGLQQGVFPWGYAIHTSENRWTYFINAQRFAEIEMKKEGIC